MSDDPKISQRYRGLPREEPPRALDEAILAASRRAVNRRRWYYPVAAAAVIVLAVAVVAHVDREQPDGEVVAPPAKVLETPPPPPVVEQPRAEAPQAAQKPARPQFAPDPQADSGRRSDAARAPAAGPAAREEQNDVAASRAPAAAEARRDREADSLARMQAQRAPASQAARASALAGAAPSPEQWLQGIVDLRRQGRHEEADRELAEFRKRYPDYRLSGEMKAKVERRQ